MLCAGAARASHLAPESDAGAVGSDAGVVFLDPELAGVGRERLILDVHASEEFGILRLELARELQDAGTDGRARLGITIREVAEFLGDDLESAAFGVATSSVIDQRVAQRAIEPGASGLRLAQFTEMVDAADEGVLEDILRQLPVAEASLEERQELAMTGDEGLQRLVRGSARFLWIGIVHDRDSGEWEGWKRRRASELNTTEILESAIVALAIMGESANPVAGSSTPAAIGIASTL